MTIKRIRTVKVADPATETWSNALLIDNEVVMSGLHGHPTTRQAAKQGVPLVEVSALVFPELCVEIEAAARLDIDQTKL